ncbi:MAG: MBL fold metallo-hydrolase [Planctomycetia bacterium]
MRDPRQVNVIPVSHPRGGRSYVVVDPATREAAIVDPLLDHVGEILSAVSGAGASVRYVIDTHSHGDHISGAAVLKERLGCEVVMHPLAASQVATRRPADQDLLPLGETTLKVWHAPGNSPDGIVLEAPGVFFTGDTMLIGSMGLKDVPGGDPHAHFETLHRLFDGRPETTVIHPGHDDKGRHLSTLKAERRGNRWLREEDYEVFRQRWETDPRRVAHESGQFLAANAEGVTKVPRDLEPALGLLDAARATEARIKGEARIAGAAERPPGALPATQARRAVVVTLLGVGTIAGWVLGTVLSDALHVVSLACGVVLLAVGLTGGERRGRKGKGGPGDELYYTGPGRSNLPS